MTDKMLIVGDIHLGKGLALGKSQPGQLNTRILDQAKLLDWILEQVDEYLVNVLVLTGDIFEDSKPDYRIFELFVSFLRQCQTRDLEVHLILGNHELRRTGNIYHSPIEIFAGEEWENVYYHRNISTINQEGFSFTVLPFRDRRSLGSSSHEEAIQQISSKIDYQTVDVPPGNYKILIGHLAFEGSIYVGDEIDDQSNELHCPLEMFSEYDYVWMGHVHKPQVLQSSPNYLAHIGSLDLSDFGESNQQKIVVLFDPEKEEKFINLPVPSRQLRKIKFELFNEIDILQFIRDKFAEEEKKKTLQSCILSLELNSSFPVSNDLYSEIKKIPFEFGIFHLAYFIYRSNSEIEQSNQDDSYQEEFHFLTPKEAIELHLKKLSLSEKQEVLFRQIANQAIEKLKSKKGAKFDS